MSKVPSNINTYLNKHISYLCPFSIGRNNTQNHCAHFVSHVMGYEFPGPTCKNFTWADKQKSDKGATIRVDDIFEKSPETGALSSKPASLAECLIFVTLSTNIRKIETKLVMGNQPKKHIGILSNGKVWNYSNTNNMVVVDQLAAFQSKFTRVYATKGTTVEFYYGKFI